MNIGQQLRLYRRDGEPVTPPLLAPVKVSDPVIVSDVPGTFKVGNVLSLSPDAIFTGADPGRTYQWRLNSSAITGANSAFYVLTSADIGGLITVTTTASNSAGSTSATSLAVGPVQAADPPIEPTAQYFNISNEALTNMLATIGYIEANEWPGYQGQEFLSDQLVTSSADFLTKWAGLNRSDRSRWHRLRLDSSQPVASWVNGLNITSASDANVTLGHYYGSVRDLATYGGGVLIESSDPENPVVLGTGAQSATYIAGVRGVHLRNLKFHCKAPLPTKASRDASRCINLAGTSTYREAIVIMLEDCHFSTDMSAGDPGFAHYVQGIWQASPAQQVTVKGCVFENLDRGMLMHGAHIIKCHDNDFRLISFDNRAYKHPDRVKDANSAWDEIVYFWNYRNTVRDPLPGDEIATGHSDAMQIGGVSDIGGFSGVSDGEIVHTPRTDYLDYVTYNVLAVPTEGQTIVFNGDVYTFRASPTTTSEILIGATRAETAINIRNAFNALKPTGVYTASAGANAFSCYLFPGGSTPTTLSGSTASFSVAGGTRYGNNTQGAYNDDCPHQMNYVAVNCIYNSSTGRGLRTWGGTFFIERCVVLRAGEICPSASVAVDGFYDGIDPDGFIDAARSYTVLPPASVTVRNSVIGIVDDRISTGAYINRKVDGTYGNGVDTYIKMEGNVFARSVAGIAAPNRPEDKLNGPFDARDSEGRLKYTFAPGLTREQFITAMYDKFKLIDLTDRANKGITDPAGWAAA
jgi:hypothetical protein